MMAGIRGKNTLPEMRVRRFLHRLGFRFRLHDRLLPGRPDLVLRKFGVVIQVHGCFWHQHPRCRYAYMPAANREFWLSKLEGNVRRDQRHARSLRVLGWRVLTIWECQTTDATTLDRLAHRIRDK